MVAGIRPYGIGRIGALGAGLALAMAAAHGIDRRRVIVIDNNDPDLPSLRDRVREVAVEPVAAIAEPAPKAPRGQSEADLRAKAAAASKRARKNARRRAA